MKKPIDTFEPTNQQVKDLRDGLQEPFWFALKEILEDEKREAEKALFDENGKFDQSQREQFRQRRNLLQYVLELPEAVIEKMKPKTEPKQPDFNTYDD
jgi:hypothetical protein